MSIQIYIVLADLLLITHALVVGFVIIGFFCIWIGYWRGWSGIRNFYFRILHLAVMGIVAIQASGGVICPLTVWEDTLRRHGGESGRYEGSFIQHWLHAIIYYDVSLELFAVIYSIFFVLVVISIIVIPPCMPHFLKKHIE